MRTISDRATSRLVEKAIKGDEQAFAKLCEAFAQDILYLCVKIMGNKPDGEDAAQEAYIKMQKGITKLENPQAFSVWLHRVVVSTCNDVHRKRGRWSQEDPIENYQEILTEGDINALPQERTEKGSEKAILLQAVNSLPDQHRTMVLLYYYKGISQKEIADVLDTTVNAVDHSLRRAKSNIRKQLEVSFGAQTDANDTRLGAVVTSALLSEASGMFIPAEVMAPLQLAGIETAAGGWAAGLLRVIRGVLPAAQGGKVALAALGVTTATAVLIATQSGSPGIGITDYTLPQSAESDETTVEIPQISLPEDLDLADLEIDGPAAATLPAGKVAASPASSSSSSSSKAQDDKSKSSASGGDESSSLADEAAGRDTPAARETTAPAATHAPVATHAPAPAPTATPAPPARPAATPAPSARPVATPAPPAQPLTPPAPPPPAPELTASITFYGTDGSVTSRNPARAVASANGGAGNLSYSWVCWDQGAGGYMTGSGSSFDIMPNGVSPETTMEISFRLELTVVDGNGNTATAEGYCSIGRP